MVYRLAANMFAHKAGADALVSPSLLQATTDVISDSVLSTDEACRLVRFSPHACLYRAVIDGGAWWPNG